MRINSKPGTEALICYALTEDLASSHQAGVLNERDILLNLTHRLDLTLRAAGDTAPSNLEGLSQRNGRIQEAAAIIVEALLEPAVPEVEVPTPRPNPWQLSTERDKSPYFAF